MHLPRLASLLLCVMLVAAAACSADATEPGTIGPRTYVAQRIVGESMPSTHYCTPYAPNTEQWVYLHSMSLTLNQFDNFQLKAIDQHGSATYTITSAGTKLYLEQSATGGTRGVTGYLAPAHDGTRELLVMSAMAIGDRIDDFTGRISGDSAIVTDRVHCDYPVGADSVHVFTVILK